MSSLFDRVFSVCAKPLLMWVNGERILYTPRTGTAKYVTAILRWQEGIGEYSRPDGRNFREQVELDVSTASSDGCPNLQVGDKFTIESEDYRVDRMPRADAAGIATVVAIRIQTRDKGSPNRLMPTGGG